MTVQMLYQKQNEYRPWKRKVYFIQSQFQNAEDLLLRLRFSVSFSYIKQTFHEKKEKKIINITHKAENGKGFPACHGLYIGCSFQLIT